MTGRAWWVLSPTGGTPPVLVIEDPGGAGDPGGRPVSCAGVAENPALWVLTHGQAHLLAGERPRRGLVARCGHPLSRGVLAHERLPSRDVCATWFSAYLLPEPVFSRTPAGHRLRPISDAPKSAPGGQPVPDAADVAVLENAQQCG